MEEVDGAEGAEEGAVDAAVAGRGQEAGVSGPQSQQTSTKYQHPLHRAGG